MNTRLCYNSTDRTYEVRLGQRVLSSHDKKEDALLSQLASEAPQALALARSLAAAHPDLADRALRAVVLVADQAVHLSDAGCSVASQGAGKDDRYQVDLAASTCTCTDWAQRAPTVNGRTLCKHLLAALFQRKLGMFAREHPIRTEVMFHDRP